MSQDLVGLHFHLSHFHYTIQADWSKLLLYAIEARNGTSIATLQQSYLPISLDLSRSQPVRLANYEHFVSSSRHQLKFDRHSRLLNLIRAQSHPKLDFDLHN